MGELQQFGENLWIVEGPNVRDFGIWFSTRMTIVKLSNGSLWVDSPVTVPADTLKRITALGPVNYLVAATPRHVWRLAGWHTQFPEAQMWAPRRGPFTLPREPLAYDGILADAPPACWAHDLDQLAFQGNPLIEEVVFLHRASHTVILDDLIQIHPVVKGKPVCNVLFRIAGVAAPHGGVPLDGRLSFIHRKRARRSLERLLSWDFDKLIIAHGPCVEKNAKTFVERAFRWLT